MKSVELYTDGACSGNPGPGGYAAILSFGDNEKVITGGEYHTTNNRMELCAAIAGLEALKQRCAVSLYSDSKYLTDGMTKGWVKRWRENGWRKPDKQPALNTDLWETLLRLCDTHDVAFRWVKGHADDPRNNRCDELARAEIDKRRAQT
jgi:ribonuclease HI